MQDINGDEFLVGDKLKVVKIANSAIDVVVGDLVVCIEDDGTRLCRFEKRHTDQEFYYLNDHLQKL